MKTKTLEDDVLEHKYSNETPLRTLWYLTRGHRRDLFISFVFFIIKHSPGWILPLLTANIIDSFVNEKSFEDILINAGLMVFLIVQNLPVNLLYVKYLSRSIRSLECSLRASIAQRLQQLSMGFHLQTNAGILQTKVVRDVEAIEQMFKNIGDGGLAAINNLIGALAITAFRVPEFIPFLIVLVPICALLIVRLRNTLEERNKDFRKEVELMSSRVNEMTTLIPVTRAHGLEETAMQRVANSFTQVKTAGLRLDAINAKFSASAWVAFQICNVLCLVLACWLSFNKIIPITAGEVVLLTTYFNILTGSVILFASLIPIITKGLESIHSIGEILQSPDLEENAGKPKLDKLDGTIEFKNVSLRYPETNFDALSKINLLVEKGQVIALVGPSGSGKSTFINLVIGFLRSTGGEILIDGKNLQSFDLRSLRRFVSVVPQESILFEGSIRENIIYGLSNVSEEKLNSALLKSNSLEFVQKLPNGAETIVGPRGAKLSGGQKQRIAIARALIRDPKILILDEATSALDSQSERLIQEGLSELFNNRTTFVVAHRLSTVQKADKIVVLENGEIVEIGPHKELVAANGLYARLFKSQKI
jgi:ATP-binding cassette subfamily B protein